MSWPVSLTVGLAHRLADSFVVYDEPSDLTRDLYFGEIGSWGRGPGHDRPIPRGKAAS
jgi:hypothetical protein